MANLTLAYACVTVLSTVPARRLVQMFFECPAQPLSM